MTEIEAVARERSGCHDVDCADAICIGWRKAFLSDLLRVRREALAQAAKTVCYGCRHDVKLGERNGRPIHVFAAATNDWALCDASAIRALLSEGEVTTPVALTTEKETT